MARVAIYRRISKDRESREYGIDRQEKLVRDKLIGPDDTVVAVYTDNDMSASPYARKHRPDYRRMLADAEAGRFDIVAAYTFKRLTRKYDEGGALLELAKVHGIGYRFVRDAPVDLNSAAGRKAFRDKINDAIAESEETSERVLDTFDQKRASGEHHGGGVRRFGFVSSSGNLVQEPTEAEAIRQAASDVLRGVSLRSIAARWNADGLRPPKAAEWVGVTVKQVLVRPSTAGLIAPAPGRGDREPVPGNWPPIIEEAMRQRLLAYFADPSRRTTSRVSQRWIGSGLYRCGACDDGTLLGSHNVNKLPGYMCTRGPGLDKKGQPARNRAHLGVQAEPVDEFVITTVVDLLRAKGPELLATDRAEDVKKANAELEAARTKKKANARLFAADAIDEAEFMTASAALTERINTAQALLAELTATNTVLTGIADAPDPGAAFVALPVERRRPVVAELMTVTILPADPSKRRVFDYERIVIEHK